MNKIILSCVVIFFIMSCATSQKATNESSTQGNLKTNTASTPADIDQIKWLLVGMKGFNMSTVNYDSGSPWVIFSVADSRVTGYSGCNSFGGSFEISNDSIKMGMMMSTKKFCDGIPEPEFMNLIGTADSYSVSNNLLNLKSKGAIILTFSKVTE